MENMKKVIIDFFNTLSVYDYIGFFLTIFLFTLFLILALLLRRRTKLSVLLVIVGFLFLFAGPSAAHIFVKKTIFKHDVQISEVRKLVYSDTLLIKGSLRFFGRKDSRHCKIDAKVHKYSPNAVKGFINELKTLASGSQSIHQQFTKGDTVNFKIVIEPFVYQGDYNITLNSGCYR